MVKRRQIKPPMKRNMAIYPHQPTLIQVGFLCEKDIMVNARSPREPTAAKDMAMAKKPATATAILEVAAATPALPAAVPPTSKAHR